MQKRNIQTNRAQRVDEKNSYHLPICHVYSQNYGYEYIKNCSFFFFSADGSKKSVTVWAKYWSASERSYLVLLDNLWPIEFWATISKISIFKNTRIWDFFLIDSAVFLIFLLLISHKW